MKKRQKDTHRKWLARRLDMDDVPQPLWRLLVEEHYVSDADENLKKGRDRLLRAARRYLKFMHEMSGSLAEQDGEKQEHTGEQKAALPPDHPVMVRAEALSLYWAKLAAADRKVEGFRRDVLGGHTISASKASSLIRSPATSILPLAKFKRESIPVGEHRAELLWLEENASSERPNEVHGELKLSWAEGEKLVPFGWKGSRSLRILPFWDGDQERLVRTLPSSVLDELHKVATKLARTFPWEPPLAAWFILTDEPPWVPPLTARASGPDSYLNHGSITITAAHWVPKVTVSNFHAEVKARMNSAPTPSRRRLLLFRFVVQHSRGIRHAHTVGLDTPRWRPLQRMWNEEHPAGDPSHYSDARNFRRDFLETFHSLVNPFRK